MYSRITIVPIIATLSIASAAVSAPPQYHVQFLGEGFTASAINERGSVVGNLNVDGTRLLAGVSHGGGPFEALPLPPGMETSRANDISDDGVIVGAVCPNEYVITQPLAAVWRPIQGGYDVQLLGTLLGDAYSSAFAINSLGDIVGGSGFFGWNLSHPVRFTESGPELLQGIGQVSDINDQRVVASGAQLLDLNSMQVQTIPPPDGNWQGFISTAMNESSDLAGSILGYSSCSTFPIRFRQSTGWHFLGGCATTTSATAINDLGDTLSYYYFTASSVYLEGEGTFSLGSLLHPSDAHWLIEWFGAADINNSRQIVAAGHNLTTGQRGAVLMTPAYSVRVSDLVGGELGTFAVGGATPLARQYITCSLLGPGSTPVPPLGVTLNLRQPVLAASGTADASGTLRRVMRLPRSASGRITWWQVAEQGRTTGVQRVAVR